MEFVCYEAFYYLESKNRKIEFEKGSNQLTIESRAFVGTSIETLILPSNMLNLRYSWLEDARMIGKIIVYPNNEQNMMLYDDKFLIGKSDVKSDAYDVLLFVPRNIKKVTIPPFIKIIGNSAFQDSSIDHIFIPKNVIEIKSFSFKNCNYFKNVDFSLDSKIEKISSNAFHNSAIESFCMPSTVTECWYTAFILCNKIKIMELSENLKKFHLREFISLFHNEAVIMIPTNLLRSCNFI